MTKILLVEDNEMNRDMLSRRLARRGFEVVVAEYGQRGIDLAGSEQRGRREQYRLPCTSTFPDQLQCWRFVAPHVAVPPRKASVNKY